MRWRACGLVGLLVSCAGCASLAAAGLSSTASAELRRGEGGVAFRRLISESYATASLAGTSLVLHQRLVRFERSGLDDDDVTLTAALVDDTAKPPAVRWSIVDHAESGRVAGALFVTHLAGLDTAESLDRYYDLATGRFLFAGTDEPVDLPAGAPLGARWIVYLAAAMPEALPCGRPGDLGVLLLAGADGVLQALTVHAADSALTPFNPSWGLVDPRSGATLKRLPNASGWRLPLPAEIRLAFDGVGEPQARVPLAAAGFDVAGARLAEGFALERRKCAGGPPPPDPEAAARHRASRGPWVRQ